MLSGITIGQYFPGNSLVHRMDPRVKLVLTFAYIIAVFIPRNWVGLAAAVAFLILSVALSRLPVKLIWKSIKPILPLILFTSIINIFFVSGDPLVDWWIIHISVQGVVTAVFIALRIVCLIAGSSLLTYTTSPTTLTDALERLMKPLKVLHVHVHEIAMMMTIALRFIPTLVEETDKIMSAQKARGADIESGGLMQRVQGPDPHSGAAVHQRLPPGGRAGAGDGMPVLPRRGGAHPDEAASYGDEGRRLPARDGGADRRTDRIEHSDSRGAVRRPSIGRPSIPCPQTMESEAYHGAAPADNPI